MATRKPLTSFERNGPYARRIAQKTTGPHWQARKSSTPPLTSISDLVPRLTPKVHSSSSSSSSTTLSLNVDMQTRLQKLSSKRDRQKQAKEDDYALDPTLVQVVAAHACARCKSQKWKCYILADTSSPRRTCLPCGKNKCTFGGSKSRPLTHPSAGGDELMAVQRPRTSTPVYDNGFSHHRNGNLNAHPPHLRLRPLPPPFPLPTPQLSPSTPMTEASSPLPRTPLEFRETREERSRNRRDEPSSDPSTPWPSQSVIHLIPSDRLRPIPLPSPAEILSREASPMRNLNSPFSTPPTSPRMHAHLASAAGPSSPHCPPSPLFPPSPDVSAMRIRHSETAITLPPLRISSPVPHTARSSSFSTPAPPPNVAPVPSRYSPPTNNSSGSYFDQPPPTQALLSLLVESAQRAPEDPRPLLIANDMMVSDSWVSRIQAARRLGQETRKPAPEYSRPYDTSFRTGSEWRD